MIQRLSGDYLEGLTSASMSALLELAKTKSERHQKIEEFFLINDSATVAVEVPVYLTEKESGIKKPLTGHIDLITG